MKNYKKKPKLKKYLKLKIFEKKNKKHFFSPDLLYLSPKNLIDFENFFTDFLTNLNKARLLLGFHKRFTLKKVLKNKIKNKKVLKKRVKELQFCSLVERRLDILLFRLKIVSNLFEAKYLIAHKKIKVNNANNKTFSQLIKKGDIISFVPSIEIKIKKKIDLQIRHLDYFISNFSNVEINWCILKIILIKNDINLFEQVQFYSFSLNWQMLINK